VSSPRVSVVLPVYNGAAFVERAVRSVLTQTFPDFELIVVDDGSTDGTADVLARLSDPRVRVVSQTNKGLSATLNLAIDLCRGTYLARQDHDDLSRPTRLAQQVSFLDAHPRCGLLGTRAEIYEGDAPGGRFHDHPLSHEALAFALLFDNPFVHSSVMVRTAVLRRLGGYSTDPRRQPPEDYELWSRIARSERMANLPERLVVYREVASSLSRVSVRPFVRMLVKLGSENMAHCLGVAIPSADMVDLAALHHGAFDLLSPSPNLARMLSLLRRAAQQLDPRDDNRELAAEVALRTRWIRRQYALRGPLAQHALTHWRRLRALARSRLR
jgi:hypothetical protein